MHGLASGLDLDPDALPFVQQENRLSQLEGTYETYRGTMRASVKRMGDFLLIEIKDRFNSRTIPLVPERVDSKACTFYTLSTGAKVWAEFTVEEGQVDLTYERYRMRRTGKLTESV